MSESNSEKRLISRRNFFLKSIGLIYIGNYLFTSYHDERNHLEVLVKRLDLNTSYKRLGLWMQSYLTSNEIKSVLYRANQNLSLNYISNKRELKGLISEDFYQGNSIDISKIQFSIIEAAVCITAASN